MKDLKIRSVAALVLGIGMALWGMRLRLHQNDIANQTMGEFILSVVLIGGGVLITQIASIGLLESSRKDDTSRSLKR